MCAVARFPPASFSLVQPPEWLKRLPNLFKSICMTFAVVVPLQTMSFFPEDSNAMSQLLTS